MTSRHNPATLAGPRPRSHSPEWHLSRSTTYTERGNRDRDIDARSRDAAWYKGKYSDTDRDRRRDGGRRSEWERSREQGHSAGGPESRKSINIIL